MRIIELTEIGDDLDDLRFAEIMECYWWWRGFVCGGLAVGSTAIIVEYLIR